MKDKRNLKDKTIMVVVDENEKRDIKLHVAQYKYSTITEFVKEAMNDRMHKDIKQK